MHIDTLSQRLFQLGCFKPILARCCVSPRCRVDRHAFAIPENEEDADPEVGAGCAMKRCPALLKCEDWTSLWSGFWRYETFL